MAINFAYMIGLACPMKHLHIIICCGAYLLTGSLFFDFVNWMSHLTHRSRFESFRLLAKFHNVHHRYFDRELKFNENFYGENILIHLLLELGCQVVGGGLTWQLVRVLYPELASTAKQSLVATSLMLSVRTGVIAVNGERDANHITYARLPKDSSFFFVGPRYHALHHIDPLNYFGSMTRLVDWILGTSFTLRGRRITMTGSSSLLGQALLVKLSRERPRSIRCLKFGTDWRYDDYSKLSATFAETDILILAHGTKNDAHKLKANFESAVTMIELFKQERVMTKVDLLPEVWYIGSGAEFEGSWNADMQLYTESKRAFARFARAYYDDDNIILSSRCS